MSNLVSVIIPTYQRDLRYLKRAVNSVRNQTYRDIEIIVIDDSTDSFAQRTDIEKFMNSISTERIIYLKNEHNLGGSLSRNRGIDAAHGFYVTFLDDDDEYMPQKVEKQVQFMQETQCDLSFSDMIMYNNSGKVVDYREHTDIKSFDNEDLLRYHLTKHLTGTPTFMFKIDKLREIGGFEDAKMGQEFYLMLKAIENGLVIRYQNDCNVKVYKHSDGGISQGKNKISGEKCIYNFKKTYFGKLSASEKKYVRFRHMAVMAVAYERNKMFIHMIAYGIAAFFVSPMFFTAEVTKFLRNLFKHRSDFNCEKEAVLTTKNN